MHFDKDENKHFPSDLNINNDSENILLREKRNLIEEEDYFVRLVDNKYKDNDKKDSEISKEKWGKEENLNFIKGILFYKNDWEEVCPNDLLKNIYFFIVNYLDR